MSPVTCHLPMPLAPLPNLVFIVPIRHTSATHMQSRPSVRPCTTYSGHRGHHGTMAPWHHGPSHSWTPPPPPSLLRSGQLSCTLQSPQPSSPTPCVSEADPLPPFPENAEAIPWGAKCCISKPQPRLPHPHLLPQWAEALPSLLLPASCCCSPAAPASIFPSLKSLSTGSASLSPSNALQNHPRSCQPTMAFLTPHGCL